MGIMDDLFPSVQKLDEGQKRNASKLEMINLAYLAVLFFGGIYLLFKGLYHWGIFLLSMFSFQMIIAAINYFRYKKYLEYKEILDGIEKPGNQWTKFRGY